MELTMKRRGPLVAIFLVACGGARNNASTSGTPVITGDTCTLHEDATSCRADSACSWYPNTRPCIVGQPCPAGWCYQPQAGDGGTGVDGGGVSAACACPGSSADVCMEQIGGPAIQADAGMTIACVTIPATCSLLDRCACLAQGAIERCWSSDQVTNLCICDNGIR
jgi:hypothetical protein